MIITRQLHKSGTKHSNTTIRNLCLCMKRLYSLEFRFWPMHCRAAGHGGGLIFFSYVTDRFFKKHEGAFPTEILFIKIMYSKERNLEIT
jgi:hypothetical protein